MNRELLERRTKMLRQHIMGVSLKNIIEALKEEYDVQEHALYQDWERRDQWIPQVLQLNDPTLLHRLIEGMRLVIPKCWVIAETSKNPFARLRALQIIKDTNLHLVEVLQAVGLVEKRPIQVDQRLIMIKGKWWESRSPLEAGKDLQEEVKQALEQEAARQAEGDIHKRDDEGANIPVS
jgi:hypothetical protein